MSSWSLLDTPKRTSLQSRADTLRTALKDFERAFAAEHDGRKPGKEDINADVDVKRRYKDYNKVRAVLDGRAGVEVLDEGRMGRRRGEVKRRRMDSTPKANRVGTGDEFEGGERERETGLPLTAIGPTPQRDGMVVGIFDLMSNPGSGRAPWSGGPNTPSRKKRKIDVLAAHGEEALVAATPEQKRQMSGGDLLQYLGSGTPATGKVKHSRTPISEGKKFMLSQFFATPSAVKYRGMVQGETTREERTELREYVLGMTPSGKVVEGEEKDTTPKYLKRSHSFKERLLSATTSSVATQSSQPGGNAPPSPVSLRTGPGFLKTRAKFQPKPLSQIAAEMRQREVESRDAEDDDKDGIDALREMEGAELNTSAGLEAEGEGGAVTRGYKKKGQKRTTRRVIMRPQPKLTKKTTALETTLETEETEAEKVEETQIPPNVPTAGDGIDDEWSDDELFQALAADEDNHARNKLSDDDDFDELQHDATSPVRKRGRAARPSKVLSAQEKQRDWETKTTKPSSDKDKVKEKTRTYNPNATSHMNFKSLKIKNKNSKGKFKGGRGGRFGRR